MSPTKRVVIGSAMKAALELIKNGSFYTTADLSELGVSRPVLKRLMDNDMVEITSPFLRGVYNVTERYVEDESVFSDRTYVLDDFAKALIAGGENSVICLYSAAYYHGFGDDSGQAGIQVGIPWSKGKPKLEWDAYQFLRWRKDRDLTSGVYASEKHKGVDIRVTSKERTVIDMFRYSPLNGKDDIDEESALKAMASYRASEEYAPAKLIRLAHEFGVGPEIGRQIKSGQFDIDASSEKESVHYSLS